MSINKNNTIIILDWDDTLFPTSWTVQNAINFNVVEVVNRYFVYFSELDTLLYKLFQKLIEKGTVIIVTNAIALWIKISARVIPNTYTLLSRAKIQIVSARDNYKTPDNSIADWKRLAFNDIIDDEIKAINMKTKSPKFLNIVSIGDANYEYNALVDLRTKKINKFLKSVKLIKDPSFETLVDELEVVLKAIPDVLHHPNNLDLNFEFSSSNRIHKVHN